MRNGWNVVIVPLPAPTALQTMSTRRGHTQSKAQREQAIANLTPVPPGNMLSILHGGRGTLRIGYHKCTKECILAATCKHFDEGNECAPISAFSEQKYNELYASREEWNPAAEIILDRIILNLSYLCVMDKYFYGYGILKIEGGAQNEKIMGVQPALDFYLKIQTQVVKQIKELFDVKPEKIKEFISPDSTLFETARKSRSS
jgi:hypothetical protein